MPNKLVIVSNESINEHNHTYYCDNIDSKSIPEGLSKNLEVILLGRKSKIIRSNKINLKNIQTASNIFTYIINVFRSFKHKDVKYLLISINPYSFITYIFLLIFNKKTFVYLRSDGYAEWKYILGKFGYYLFHIMFIIISSKAKLISCTPGILKGKPGKIVSPSQLSKKWFLSFQKPNLNKIKLLYVGRIKVEKGIFSLLEIIKKIKTDVELSIVGVGKKNKEKINQENVKIFDFYNENDAIIKIYDEHNIFILPSFTEGHPQVLDESLSRHRPVIIFDEISHIVGKRKGIFISKRDAISLSNTINYIIKNYYSIQEEIMQNTLPTKENFINEILNIINEKKIIKN